MRFLNFLFLAVALAACSAPPTANKESGSLERANTAHDPVVLDQVAEAVRTQDKSAGQPVVVFDLDDTLFDVRTRHLAIAQEFAREAQSKIDFPDAAAKLEKAKISDMKYGPAPTFEALGIDDAKALDRFKAYWTERFFTNRYCQLDEEVPGAVAYVKRLHKLGAHIVYFTGRDIPRMKKGTLVGLRQRGFPLDRHTSLILKASASQDDLEFKREKTAEIRERGTVVGAFENEPRNLNLFGEAFPKAILVFLDTLHSSAPDAPTAEAHWVKDYLPSLKGNSDG